MLRITFKRFKTLHANKRFVPVMICSNPGEWPFPRGRINCAEERFKPLKHICAQILRENFLLYAQNIWDLWLQLSSDKLEQKKVFMSLLSASRRIYVHTWYEHTAMSTIQEGNSVKEKITSRTVVFAQIWKQDLKFTTKSGPSSFSLSCNAPVSCFLVCQQTQHFSKRPPGMMMILWAAARINTLTDECQHRVIYKWQW